MADAKSDELWLVARAQAAQLSDADLMRQVRATDCLSAALRAEIKARRSGAAVEADRRRIKAWLDSLPTSS